MNNLKNKKVLLFAPELEKFEHRGIAFYTKSLINALFESGAEIWLVTSFNINDLNIKKYEKNSRNYIYNYEILKSFNDGIDFNLNKKFLIQFLQFKYKNKTFQKLKLFIQILLGNNTYGRENTNQIKFNYKEDNPYLKLEKLSYMRYISGFLSDSSILVIIIYLSVLLLFT